MATIKIDRGFTQKIQQKGLTHSLAEPPLPPHRTKPAKKGAGTGVIVGVVAGAVVVIGGIIAVAVALTSDKKPPARPSRPAAAPAAAAPQAPEAASESTEVVPVDESALYAQHQAKPAQPAPAAAPAQAWGQPAAPVLREVPVGSAQGLLCDYYEGVKGHLVSDLRKAPSFPGSPDRTVQVRRFELSEKLGENYGVRVRGYVTPPQSGAYTFVVNADDGGELWLSSDDSPNNLKKRVAVTMHTQKKWDLRPDQRSEPVDLEAGKSYYVEAYLKQSTGGDYLAVGWSGPVGDKVSVIESAYLKPWSERPSPLQAVAAASAAAASRRKAWAAFEAARAPALEAVAEQMKANGSAHRYAEAAASLKKAAAAAPGEEARSVLEEAALRFEALALLRAFVQAELARAPLRGVWVAFGGQADVTGANDEGLTVAPGRIVAWGKVPADQMLRLINATVPKASGDGARKGALLLAAAVYCKEVQGGVELAMKYRERALAANAALEASADRLLGGSPEAILAQPRIRLTLGELDQAAAAAGRLSEECEALRQKVEAASAAPQPGLTVEYWDNAVCSSIDDLRNKGITTKRQPDVVAHLADFELPRNRADQYVARIKGFLSPAESGEYLFFIASDDHSELWLSPDENPDKAVLCVKNDAAVGVKQWDKEKRASKPVRLEKGRRYFVKGLLREGSQTDHLEVAWCLASQGEPKLIAGEFLTCLPASGAPAAGSDDGRTKALSELGRAQERLAESLELCGPGGAPSEACGPQAPQVADALQRQLSEAKAKLQEAEALLRAARERAPKE